MHLASFKCVVEHGELLNYVKCQGHLKCNSSVVTIKFSLLFADVVGINKSW